MLPAKPARRRRKNRVINLDDAEASMMEGLSEIKTPQGRRVAVDRMVASAHSFANKQVEGEGSKNGRE